MTLFCGRYSLSPSGFSSIVCVSGGIPLYSKPTDTFQLSAFNAHTQVGSTRPTQARRPVVLTYTLLSLQHSVMISAIVFPDRICAYFFPEVNSHVLFAVFVQARTHRAYVRKCSGPNISARKILIHQIANSFPCI